MAECIICPRSSKVHFKLKYNDLDCTQMSLPDGKARFLYSRTMFLGSVINMTFILSNKIKAKEKQNIPSYNFSIHPSNYINTGFQFEMRSIVGAIFNK